MAWVNICSKTYDSNYNTGKVKVVVQYNDSNITTTSLTCRAIGYLTGWDGSCEDTYFIYSSDGGISRICYLGGTKTKKDGLSYYTSNNFTLTKTKTATSFSLPELRLCNDGSHHSTSSYTDSNGRGYAIYWNNQRHMWTTVNSGGSTISTSVYVTNIGTGTVDEVKDNYNNSYTVKVTRGAARTYNKVNGALLYWAHTKNANGTWSYSKASNSEEFSTTSHSKTISFTPSTAAEREVVGCVVTDGEHNDTDSGWRPSPPLKVRQYLAPPTPSSNPSISYNKSRLTIKEPWTISWGAATKVNDSCPIKGYRIRIYRKRGTGSWTAIDFHDASNNKLTASTTLSTGSTVVAYTRNGGSTTTFVLSNPAKYFQAGDKVKIMVSAYTRFGKNNDGTILINDNNVATSAEYTVLNAGVMRVRPTSTSGVKEGVVWVKVLKNGAAQWVEADIVKTKTSSTTWSEST